MFKYALDLVFRRKLRTFLTSLGILISVMLMSFILFGMSDLQTLIVGQFSEQFKPDELYVSSEDYMSMMGSFGSAPTKEEEKEPVIMNDEILNEVADIDGVETVEPLVMIAGVEMYLEGDDTPYPTAYPAGTNLPGDNHLYRELLEGNDLILDEGEAYVSSFVADYYGLSYEDILGKTVVLKSLSGSIMSFTSKSMVDKEYEFEVVGVVDTGSDVMFTNIPDCLDVLVDLGGYEDDQDYIDTVGYTQLLLTIDVDKVDSIQSTLEEDMNLSVISTETITSFIGMLTTGLTMALILFGSISALVASIGIINTMIMSIYEQTKEIGIIKAIGASNFQVMVIFLIQAGLIGLIGGAMGLVITYLMMRVADPIIVSLLIDNGFSAEVFFHFRFDYAIYIVMASILVGILAGLYPAYKASRLDPVKALRYE